MTMRFLRTFVALAFAIVAFARPCTAQSDSEEPQVVTTAIVLKIATDKSHYKVGEPILLRSALYNASSVSFDVLSGYASEMVAVTIRDAAAAVVKPAHYARVRQFSESPVGVALAAGSSRYIPGIDREEWPSIADWGYGSLPPGHYTVTGVLSAIAFRTPSDDQRDKPVQRISTTDENGRGVEASASFDVTP